MKASGKKRCEKGEASSAIPIKISTLASFNRISDMGRENCSSRQLKKRTLASGIKVCVTDTVLGPKPVHYSTTRACGRTTSPGATVYLNLISATSMRVYSKMVLSMEQELKR